VAADRESDARRQLELYTCRVREDFSFVEIADPAIPSTVSRNRADRKREEHELSLIPKYKASVFADYSYPMETGANWTC